MDPIDKTTFDELRETAGAEFVAELVDTFLEEAPPMLAALRAARQVGSADEFRRAAHSLKSNGATFGAHEVTALARTLELAGLSPVPARDLETIDTLDAAYRRAAAALQELARG